MAMPTDEQKKQIHDDIFRKTENALKRAGLNRSKVAKELATYALVEINQDNIDDTTKAKLKLDALKTVAAMLGMEKPKEVKHIGEIEHNHNHGVTPEIKEILDAFLGGGREV